ncbi:MAG: hypothetical protein GY851_10320 [bacterium]|nr:hypothetical protein [bacterium]
MFLVAAILTTAAAGQAQGGEAAGSEWGRQPLRTIPIAYRHDGFSIYFHEERPMTPERLCERFVDPLAGTNATINVWGVGPGSVFCYDTKVGEVFGEGLTDDQRAMLREGDLRVHANVMGLIESGKGPLRIAVERSHELGLKLIARLEINHEYGPASDDNWQWVAFVGSFNKTHPECRIGDGVLLDFKHKEVRDFKLSIFRETLEAGADGVSIDLAVYPPFFADPEAGTPIMTQFMRDVRALLDEFTGYNDPRKEMMVRLPARNANDLGLDWQTWLREGLVDYLVPTHYRPNEQFDVAVDEYIALGRETNTKVYPCIWQVLGFVDTDPRPQDDDTGNRRYDKPKTPEMFNAQALLFHRAGAEGLQLGFSEDQWRLRPYLNDLADGEKMLVADKHYMVDVLGHCPIEFPLPEIAPFTVEQTVPLRIGDDIPAAREKGYTAKATMVLYAKPMQTGETLLVYVNGHGPITVSGEHGVLDANAVPLNPRKISENIFDKEWWRRGEQRMPVDASWWTLGTNEIRFEFTGASADREQKFHITWVDLLLDYEKTE